MMSEEEEEGEAKKVQIGPIFQVIFPSLKSLCVVLACPSLWRT